MKTQAQLGCFPVLGQEDEDRLDVSQQPLLLTPIMGVRNKYHVPSFYGTAGSPYS